MGVAARNAAGEKEADLIQQTGLRRAVRPQRLLAGAALILALLAGAGPGALQPAPAPATMAQQQTPPDAALTRLPLTFIENRGQVAEGVGFYARDGITDLFFTPDGFRAHMGARNSETPAADVRVQFAGARDGTAPRSLEPAEGVVNIFTGNDPRAWYAGIPTHARIGYEQPWPGIDIAYDGRSSALESTYVVSSEADPGTIRLRYTGHDGLSLAPDGGLRIHTPGGALSESAPTVYQAIDHRRVSVQGRYDLIDGDTVGFAIGEYDRSLPLVIDPVLTYSTYFGGSGSDQANDIAVDALGNAYITGFTTSTGSPPAGLATPSAFQTVNAGSRDAFVTKFNPAGSLLLYSTYLGGLDVDEAKRIAVDASGVAYVTGTTFSTNFPTSVFPSAALQAANAGGQDAFISKLDPSGVLTYSTYLGGSSDDIGRGIAINGGKMFVTGTTLSADYPLLNAPVGNALLGLSDAFVTELSAAGDTLVFSRYLGGDGADDGRGIAVDGSDNAYVTGSTKASTVTSFPTTVGLPFGGVEDAFVAKFNGGGLGAIAHARFLGGSGADGGYDIVLDAGGVPYLTGITASATDFPTTPGVLQTANGGGGFDDAFVTKLGTDLSLTYSTYLGGTAGDAGASIAVGASGNAYVTGSTFSSIGFPLSAPFQGFHSGAPADAFVTQLNATGNALVYSSYLGGTGTDRGWGIATDSTGNAYVTGSTQSSGAPPAGFPLASPYQGTYNGLADAFVTKVGIGPPPAVGGIAEAPDLLALRRDSGSNTGAGAMIALAIFGAVSLAGGAAAAVARKRS